MGNVSDGASHELADISDVVGIICDVCINPAIDLSVGLRSSA